MKTTLFALAALFFAPPALAAYEIQMELELPGQGLALQTVKAEAGQPTYLTFGDTLLELEPQDHGHGTVLVKAQISQHLKDAQEGVQTIIARPQIITKLKHSATISQRGDDGQLVFRLKVTPRQMP